MTKLLLLLKKKPIKGEIICKKLGIKDAKLRTIVHDLRLKGYGIISGPNGYSKTKSKVIIEKCAKELTERGSSIIEAAKGMLK